MRSRLTFLFIGFALSVTSASGSTFNVCSITINSNDEIKAIQSKLEKSKTTKYTFTELTPPKGENAPQNWFEEKCKQGIKCDMLVISGHFGGTFFGKSGYSLSLEQMEVASCNRNCDGILSQPTEVFLFGCNTLAERDRDRDPEEYRRVLIADGLAPEYVDRVVEARYGIYGRTNRERMQSVFRGVPHLYGFKGRGPKGENVDTQLTNYLNKVPDYGEHLRQEQGNRLLKIEPNKKLADTLSETAFAQCSGGSRILDAKEERRCRAYRMNGSPDDKVKVLREIVESPDFIAELPAATHILKTLDVASLSPEGKKNWEAIQQNTEKRNELEQVRKKIHSPYLSIEIAKMSVPLGWVKEEEYKATLKENIQKLFSGVSLTIEAKDLICSLPIRIEWDEVKLSDRAYNDGNLLKALSCISSPSEASLPRLLQTFTKANEEWGARETSFQILRDYLPQQKSGFSHLAAAVKSATQDSERVALFQLIGKMANSLDDEQIAAAKAIIAETKFDRPQPKVEKDTKSRINSASIMSISERRSNRDFSKKPGSYK